MGEGVGGGEEGGWQFWAFRVLMISGFDYIGFVKNGIKW